MYRYKGSVIAGGSWEPEPLVGICGVEVLIICTLDIAGGGVYVEVE